MRQPDRTTIAGERHASGLAAAGCATVVMRASRTPAT
jgi:hypothetical protein